MTDRSVRADQLAHARRSIPQADDARLAEIRAYAGFLSAIGPDAEGGRLGYLLARVDQLTTERDGQRVQLTSAADALSAIARAVIAVEPALKVPYSDAPEHSPWSRFVERPTRTAYNLGRAIKRSLREIKESPDA